MFAIFKREIRSYFQTVVGWLFIAAVLALYGLYFYAYNLRSGSPYVSYSLSAVSFIVMIAVPVLTKALNTMQTKGLVELHRGEIILPNVENLIN